MVAIDVAGYAFGRPYGCRSAGTTLGRGVLTNAGFSTQSQIGPVPAIFRTIDGAGNFPYSHGRRSNPWLLPVLKRASRLTCCP